MLRALLRVVVIALLGAVGGPAAAEKPPATLIGPDAAIYMELNLDRLQAKTPDLAALRQALSRMQALKVAEHMFSQDPSKVVAVYETAHPGDCPSGGEEDVASERHLGGSNYGFADGHAKWHAADEPVIFEETSDE